MKWEKGKGKRETVSDQINGANFYVFYEIYYQLPAGMKALVLGFKGFNWEVRAQKSEVNIKKDQFLR